MAAPPIRDLATESLRLEPLLADHAERLFPEVRDPRLYPYIPQDPPASVERLADRFRRLEPRRSPDGGELWLNWAVRRRSDGAYVGMMEATVTEDRTAEIAYFVFTPYQRRGYARESCERVVRTLFEDYEASKVVATMDTRNAASVALVESLGFRRGSTVRAADSFKGSVSDEVRYERIANPAEKGFPGGPPHSNLSEA